MTSRIIDFFDGRAKHYERILSLPFIKALERDEIEAVLRKVDAGEKAVLDVGCGHGKFCNLWNLQDARFVVGIDFSSEMIGAARDKCGPNFLRGDAFNLPFPGDSFDIVSCIGLANYYQDITPLLDEIIRVGEEYVITFPGKSLLGRIYKIISPVGIHLRTKEEIEDLLSLRLRDLSVVECASGLTLLARGRR